VAPGLACVHMALDAVAAEDVGAGAAVGNLYSIFGGRVGMRGVQVCWGRSVVGWW
jgi:hypothetical protein